MELKPVTNKNGMTSGFIVALIVLVFSIVLNFLSWYFQNNSNFLFIFILQIILSFVIFFIMYSVINAKTTAILNFNNLFIQLEEQDKKFNSLTKIMNPVDDINIQFQSALEAGVSSLNLEIGLVTQIDGNNYSILKYLGPSEINLSDIGKTCCTITLYANDSVAIDNMGKSVFRDHPCYKNYKFESYIGTSIVVNGKRFGTINFMSIKPKPMTFTQEDRDFVQLIAQLLSHSIEHKYWKELLKANKEELDWLNKIKIGRELKMIELKKEILKFKNGQESPK